MNPLETRIVCDHPLSSEQHPLLPNKRISLTHEIAMFLGIKPDRNRKLITDFTEDKSNSQEIITPVPNKE